MIEATQASNETFIRLGSFATILLLMALWESRAPRRPRSAARAARWPGNLGIVAIDTLIVRLLFPLTAVGMALLMEARGWGFFHALSVPHAAGIILAILLLDLAIYLQHV